MLMKDWVKEVSKSQADTQDKLGDYIAKFDKNKNSKETMYNDILDIMYNGLGDAYKISKNCLKDVYGESSSHIPVEKELKNLTYHKDNQYLDERIKGYVEDFYSDKITKAQLLKKTLLAQDTESMCVFNNAMRNIMKEKGYVGYRVIAFADCRCHSTNCNEMAKKDYDIADLTGIPPFHPNCECTIEFIKENE